MKLKHEKPSDEDVVATLNRLGGEASAQELFDELIRVDGALSPRHTQLAIQRVYDRGLITLDKEWKLRVAAHDAIAA